MNHSISSTVTGKTKIKVVFLGGQSVGKSSIIEKYIHDRFDDTSNPTVGIDFLAKNVTHRGKHYRLQLWDTAGQQRFRSLIPSYLKDAHCAFVVFDVTSQNSLGQVEMWINLFNQNKGGDGFIFLVGNKIDLEYRQVSMEEGKAKAAKFNLPYHEISAKSGQNVQDLFLKLIDHTTENSLNAHILNNVERKQVIKEEQGPKEQEQSNKNGPDETGTKLTAINKEGVEVSQNVVLKNQKITGAGRSGKQKGCC